MSEKYHDFGSLVCIYAQMPPRIKEVGKRLGYAIAIHGTMSRDLDILAVPWIDQALSAEDLVLAVSEIVGGYVIGDVSQLGKVDSVDCPTRQPHGRKSWNICWGGKPLIDLSIMPRSGSDAP